MTSVHLIEEVHLIEVIMRERCQWQWWMECCRGEEADTKRGLVKTREVSNWGVMQESRLEKTE